MDVDLVGHESAGAPPGRGTKRPASPTTSPSDGDDSSMSTTGDDGWEVSDWGSEDEGEEEEEGDDDQERMCLPFTIDDFPRFSSDWFVQNHTLYRREDIRRRGPSLLILFPSFKDPVSEKYGGHVFGRYYRLDNESEISVNHVGTVDCSNKCDFHFMNMLQLIDIQIAGYRHTQPGRAKIFGFFAVRDRIEPLRNYVYRRGIDNYEAVSVKRKTGMARLSLTSPARGIGITSRVLFEFRLCIRTEDPPEDEPSDDVLIEGCTEITNIYESKPFVKTGRLYGEKCGLDVTFAVLISAVQAIIDVEILRAPVCGFNLKLYAKTSGFNNVIRLFQGVAEVGRRLSSVVAVMWRRNLDLCIIGSSMDNGLYEKWECRFDACHHGTVDEVVKLDDFTTVSVRITWKSLR